MNKLKLAVTGAGMIGKNHIALIEQSADCELAAIVEPGELAPELQQYGDIVVADLAEVLSAGQVDGVILATPNALHVRQALQCLEAGVPALIEKPVADSVADGEQLLARVRQSGLSFLVGHHRMYSPIMVKAREVVDSGVLGELVAVNGSALFHKPDAYFEQGAWRSKAGGGPILINMIHEVGNLRYLCGEIVAVQALQSNTRRGFEVEDSAAMVFSFASGALGTFMLSDCAASPRSWEQTSQENPAYPAYPLEDCYHLAGTRGSLSVPSMQLHHYGESEASWWQPFVTESVDLQRADPLALQLQHFCQVIRGEAEPRVSVYDGLQNLRVTEALSKAAASGEKVYIDSISE
ncbi:MAG: Gfo/Idh/MocA family oxidoreductase [Thiolinea sp.]